MPSLAWQALTEACVQVREQSRAVWHFILDREVEAPARFCSIQTFRAALAVMTQQVCLPLTVVTGLN